jgi:hypothetical protein
VEPVSISSLAIAKVAFESCDDVNDGSVVEDCGGEIEIAV